MPCFERPKLGGLRAKLLRGCNSRDERAYTLVVALSVDSNMIESQLRVLERTHEEDLALGLRFRFTS